MFFSVLFAGVFLRWKFTRACLIFYWWNGKLTCKLQINVNKPALLKIMLKWSVFLSFKRSFMLKCVFFFLREFQHIVFSMSNIHIFPNNYIYKSQVWDTNCVKDLRGVIFPLIYWISLWANIFINIGRLKHNIMDIHYFSLQTLIRIVICSITYCNKWISSNHVPLSELIQLVFSFDLNSPFYFICLFFYVTVLMYYVNFSFLFAVTYWHTSNLILILHVYITAWLCSCTNKWITYAA